MCTPQSQETLFIWSEGKMSKSSRLVISQYTEPWPQNFKGWFPVWQCHTELPTSLSHTGDVTGWGAQQSSRSIWKKKKVGCYALHDPNIDKQLESRFVFERMEYYTCFDEFQNQIGFMFAFWDITTPLSSFACLVHNYEKYKLNHSRSVLGVLHVLYLQLIWFIKIKPLI